MKLLVKMVIVFSLFMSMAVYSFAEEKTGRYQIYSTMVYAISDKASVGFQEPVVFLLDTETGTAWTYVRATAKGTLMSIWSPVIPSKDVYDSTKQLVGEVTGKKMMEEAKQGIQGGN